jgi:hypothetical protein
MVMTLGPDELMGPPPTSLAGRTATFSSTGFSTTSFENPPYTATKPSDSADPIRPATTATAHVLVPDDADAEADADGAPGAPATDADAAGPSSDG